MTEFEPQRERPWTCTECGYVLDSSMCLEEPARMPHDDDLTFCVKCTHLYIRRANQWTEPTVDDYLSFDRETKASIEQNRKLIKQYWTEKENRVDKDENREV